MFCFCVHCVLTTLLVQGNPSDYALSGGVLTDQQVTLGTPADIMNPYMSINYIIYTGPEAS